MLTLLPVIQADVVFFYLFVLLCCLFLIYLSYKILDWLFVPNVLESEGTEGLVLRLGLLSTILAPVDCTNNDAVSNLL